MNFIMGLPRMAKGYNSIWVIVDRLTKSAHFIPVDTKYTAKKYAEIYFDQIVTLHGVLLLSSLLESQFCLSFLGATAALSWYSPPQKLNMSSTNWWSNWKGEPGAQGYVEGLCHLFSWEVG